MSLWMEPLSMWITWPSMSQTPWKRQFGFGTRMTKSGWEFIHFVRIANRNPKNFGIWPWNNTQGKRKRFSFKDFCVRALIRKTKTFEVSVMVEGAGCWTDETEKPGFRNAQLFVAYMLAWPGYEKFLIVLYTSSARSWPFGATDHSGGRADGQDVECQFSCTRPHGRDQFDTIIIAIIALCIRSGCAICPAVTHVVDTSSEKREVDSLHHEKLSKHLFSLEPPCLLGCLFVQSRFALSQLTPWLFVLSLFLRLRVKNWNWNWIVLRGRTSCRGKGSVDPGILDWVWIFTLAIWHCVAGRVFVWCVATYCTNCNWF